MEHLFLSPGPTSKEVSPSFLTALLSLASKCTLAQKKISKTECVFFLPPGFFKTQTLPLTYLTNSSLELNKKESDKKRHTNEDEEYTKCRETVIIKVKGIFVTFTKHFKYLGSYISYSLKDDYGIDILLAAGNASMESLSKFWTDASVNNSSNYLIFLAIPINILLWRCESWALQTSLLKNLRYSYTAASDKY